MPGKLGSSLMLVVAVWRRDEIMVVVMAWRDAVSVVMGRVLTVEIAPEEETMLDIEAMLGSVVEVEVTSMEVGFAECSLALDAASVLDAVRKTMLPTSLLDAVL